jgi:hypothetical protein
MNWGALGGLAVVFMVVAPNAHAGEVDSDGSARGLLNAVHPEAAGRFMVGTALTAPDTTPGPGIAAGGAGVRAGVSYLGFYAGLSFVDFFSESSGLGSYPGSYRSDAGASYGLEVGYGHTFFRRLTLRGLLGAGDYAVTAEGAYGTCSGAPSCAMITTTYWHASRDNFYLAPGALLEVALGPVLIGVDANLIYIPSAEGAYAGAANVHPVTFASITGGAQLGVRL